VAGPHPAVAAVRLAVRRELADLPEGALVLTACSGGADSLALADAAAFEAGRRRLRAGVLHVDHRLQPGSADQARQVHDWALAAGLTPVEVLAAADPRANVQAAGGPEAAARDLRYRLLAKAAERHDAAAVLLGHTRDDQAETVLLALARGSGARSLAGMAPRRERYRRPLLDLDRSTVRAAATARALPVWDDPHNADPAYARVRTRLLLGELERALPGATAGLARSAALLRADADALDPLAAAAVEQVRTADGGLDVLALAALPGALRTRVLHAAARAAGAPPGRLASVHVGALDALVGDWHGQGPVWLPGRLVGYRSSGRLYLQAVVLPAAGERSPGTPRRGVAEGAGVYDDDIASVLISEKEIAAKIDELSAEISADYADREVLLVAVLKGAVMFMADLARSLTRPVTLEFMAVSSYGSSTSSSGVVRILKDLDRDIAGRHVLVVEDIIDSGLTLSWLLKNLRSRQPASLEVVALLRKPEASQLDVAVRYVGFDIPNEFVVGYGLDYAERYRDLPFVGLLRPEVYTS